VRERERERGRQRRAFFEAASICGRRAARPLDGEQIATVSAPGSSRSFLSGFSGTERVRSPSPRGETGGGGGWEGESADQQHSLASSYFWRWFSFCQDDG